MWQQAAEEEWRRRLEADLPVSVVTSLNTLAPNERGHWLRGLNRAPHPVAEGMANWLSRLDDRRWFAVPADAWGIRETDAGVLISYPEPWGFDPLTMTAMAILWAGDRSERWQAMASFLGPVALLAAAEAGLASEAVRVRFSDYRNHYRVYEEAWHLDRLAAWWSTEAHLVVESWPVAPNHDVYREQLAFGVVPHEVRGAVINNEVAVLVALYEMGDRERPMMAGLAYKALEGRWLWEAWQKAR